MKKIGTVTLILITVVIGVTGANANQLAPANTTTEIDALKGEVGALARQIEELKNARTATSAERSPDPMLSEVLAAGINSGHAMEMLARHADLLTTMYGFAGGLLAALLAIAALVGYRRISDIKEELSQSLETKLAAVKSISDRDHAQVMHIFNWYTGVEARMHEAATSMHDITDKTNTRLSELHQEASLKASYNECSQLSGVVRVLRPLSEISERMQLETSRMLTNFLEKMLEAANKGIGLATDKSSRWWMVFHVFRGVALKDLGRYQAALDEMENILVATELPDMYKATPYNNAACYACLLNQEEKALAHLERAVYLDLTYKSRAKTDPDFQQLWDNPRFKELVA